jgi:endonuclease-3
MISIKVPSTIKELMELPGIGIKTANVFITEIHNADAIGVDTHVYRIAKKLGWANSKYHEKVGKELMELFPRKMWKEINPTLVRFGKEYGRSSRKEDEILNTIK